MSEPTKEQMLEYFDGILNRLDYEYTRTPLFKQMTAAIESLIESSSPSGSIGVAEGEKKNDEAYWRKITGDADKRNENKEPGAGPRIFPSVGQNPTLGGPSPGPLPTPTIKKDLTVEVEEAIHTIGLYIADDELRSNAQAALAVIRAALKYREEMK